MQCISADKQMGIFNKIKGPVILKEAGSAKE